VPRKTTFRGCGPGRPASIARHRAFLARVRRGERIPPPAAPIPQRFRRTRTIALHRHTVFTFGTAVRLNVVMPGSPPRIQSVSMLRTERISAYRHHRHTHERVETRVLERMGSIFVQRSAVPALQRATDVPPTTRRTAKRTDFSRVVMTMAHPAVPVALREASPDAPRHARTAPDRPGPPLHFGTAAVAPLPAHELSRVTEHVLRTLDRRVLSYRERTGYMQGSS